MKTIQRKRTVVFGAGGHAHSVCDILLQCRELQIVGLLDGTAKQGFFGIPLLGDDSVAEELFKEKQVEYFFVAIGSNSVRKKLTEKALCIGLVPINAISNNATISPYATLETGIAVMPGAVINAGASIGQGSIINTNSSIDHDTVIGDFCHIAPGCAICGGVNIGCETFLGVGACAIDHVNICNHVIVGAGAVVTKDIIEPCTAVGVPAKKLACL